MGKTEEAVQILRELGLPRGQLNERSGLTLLALLDLREEVPWPRCRKQVLRIHSILAFIQDNYGKQYAENTRETIRRQTLHQFEQAGVAARNPDDPARPTNSPNTVYAVTDEMLGVVRKYGTRGWERALKQFVSRQGKLAEKYGRIRQAHFISVDLPDGDKVALSLQGNTTIFRQA